MIRKPVRHLAAGAVTVLLLGACQYSELNGIGTRTGDDQHPPQLDLASFDGCEKGDLDQWRASAELVNNSPTTASYEVVVAFYENDTRISQRSHWVRDLRPGERAVVDRGWWVDNPDRVTSCDVLLINRFG